MALISGSWENTKLVCGNHPAGELPEMELELVSRVPTYCCPKCNPLNCSDNEPICRNRLSAYEYEKMLDYVAGLIADADDAGETPNLKSYTWRRKAISFKILEHKGDAMTIAVIDGSVAPR